MSITGWLEVVADLAKRTGDVALSRYRRGIDIEEKEDGSPVTIADRAAEEFARSWIVTRFPTHGVMGEELGTIRPEARLRWLVDPIDGTRSFVAGVPLWGTLIALCDGDTVLAGAAAFPATGDVLAGERGFGAWINGNRCAVSSVASLDRATVLTTDERFSHTPDRRAGWNRIAKRAATARTWGDCYGYMLVATGRAEVMIDGSLRPWDSAPFLPIMAEAGGVFVDFTGKATAFGDGAIATNAAIATVVHNAMGVGR